MDVVPDLTEEPGVERRSLPNGLAGGLADADAGVLAEPRTPYRIGSITKTFTLHERYGLSTDAVVARVKAELG